MNLTITCLIIAGVAALLFLHGRYFVRSETISRTRVDRAINPTKAPTASADHLPSIVRTRYAAFRSSDKLKTAIIGPLIRLALALELLGINFSLFGGLATLGVTVLFFSFLVHLITKIDLITSSFISFTIILSTIYMCMGIAKNKMLTKFQRLFPDALDLVVRSVRAGLPVSEAIKMISAEVPNPVGAAFSEVGSNISIGINLDDALDQLATNIPIAELRFFAISLAVQQETGGNLAEILSNLSKLMRKRVQVKKKIRALSSEARASAIIIGSLPFVVGAVIFSFNRSYIEVLFYDDNGRFLMLCALASIVTGGIIMAKLIRFKI